MPDKICSKVHSILPQFLNRETADYKFVQSYLLTSKRGKKNTGSINCLRRRLQMRSSSAYAVISPLQQRLWLMFKCQLKTEYTLLINLKTLPHTSAWVKEMKVIYFCLAP